MQVRAFERYIALLIIAKHVFFCIDLKCACNTLLKAIRISIAFLEIIVSWQVSWKQSENVKPKTIWILRLATPSFTVFGWIWNSREIKLKRIKRLQLEKVEKLLKEHWKTATDYEISIYPHFFGKWLLHV